MLWLLLLLLIIIIQHLFMRHISGHCGHSEAHYKHLHIINNLMIKMPTDNVNPIAFKMTGKLRCVSFLVIIRDQVFPCAFDVPFRNG